MKRAAILLWLLALGFTAHAQEELSFSPDLNQDGVVGTNDLMLMLSAYGYFDEDFDGVWDHQDACVGAHDACGICNGPGATVQVIDEILYTTDSTFNALEGTWEVFDYASDTLFIWECPVEGCTDANALNYDPLANTDDGSCEVQFSACDDLISVSFFGYEYALIGIGEQCWFAENLRTEHYLNGDVIPSGLNDAEWAVTTDGAMSLYDEGSEDAAAHLEAYGRLYNWYALGDPRGVCPNGWHAPTDADFSELVNALGGSLVAGMHMKSAPSDDPAWDGTNASGFSVVPGGNRSFGGGFSNAGDMGYQWSATSTGTSAWSRRMSSGNSGVSRLGSSLRMGFSVRCVRDE
jgi:uncharacterized protein (TIGR02145 family)